MANKSDNTGSPRRKRVWFGPGTVAGLVLALGIIVTGALNRPPDQGLDAGRVAFETDGRGGMRRVEGPLTTVSEARPVIPLWKPEVALLSDNAAALSLSEAQRTKLGAVDRAWRREKAALLAEMDRTSAQTSQAASATQSERGAPLGLIREGMTDYSALSRQYDERRRDYWAQATTLLTPAQRTKLDALQAAATYATKAKRP
jgi:hypothetical protein